MYQVHWINGTPRNIVFTSDIDASQVEDAIRNDMEEQLIEIRAINVVPNGDCVPRPGVLYGIKPDLYFEPFGVLFETKEDAVTWAKSNVKKDKKYVIEPAFKVPDCTSLYMTKDERKVLNGA